MIELGAAFILGVGGSLHCVGMCGGIALAQQRKRVSETVRDQLVYHAGRTLSYTLLGAIAGSVGHSLVRGTDVAVAQTALASVLGALLVVAGLKLAGLIRITPALRPVALTIGKSLNGLTRRGTSGSFQTGLLTPLLPCSLLASALILAAVSGAFHKGAATMFVFTLGTAPALILLTLVGHVATARLRASAMRVAGAALAMFGALTIVRGIAALGDGCCRLI